MSQKLKPPAHSFWDCLIETELLSGLIYFAHDIFRKPRIILFEYSTSHGISIIHFPTRQTIKSQTCPHPEET